MVHGQRISDQGKSGQKRAETWPKCVQKEAIDRFCICMVKKIKINKKTTIEKVSFCTNGLEVLVYNNNVCHLVQIKSVM